MSLQGRFDGVFGEHVVGWARDASEPDRTLFVDIVVDGRPLCSASAGAFRVDLLREGIGDGTHAFDTVLPAHLLDGQAHRLEVFFGGLGIQLPGSPHDMPAGSPRVANFKIDVKSQHDLPRDGRWSIGLLLVELNDTCNADCIYCPNPRTRDRLDLQALAGFLDHRLDSVDTVQFGCGQEPTADPRLGEAFRILAASPLRPRNVRLITNGSLLHRHDAAALQECGLTTLAISLDSSDEELNDRLRPGAPLRKVVANVRAFRERCPEVELELSATVTRLNVDGMTDLVRFGVGLGATRFILREVVDTSRGNARQRDFAQTYATLALGDGDFARMRSELLREHGALNLVFQPRAELEAWVDSAAEGVRRLGAREG